MLEPAVVIKRWDAVSDGDCFVSTQTTEVKEEHTVEPRADVNTAGSASIVGNLGRYQYCKAPCCNVINNDY